MVGLQEREPTKFLHIHIYISPQINSFRQNIHSIQNIDKLACLSTK